MSLTEILTPGQRDTEAWPILVISLADAHERRQSIQKQCAELGLEFEFIDAIDGRAGLAPEFESEVDREAAGIRLGRPMMDAEIACALSHRLAYARIVDSGAAGAVILEDDAILSAEFAYFIGRRGYREADFVQMLYRVARTFKGQRRQWSEGIELAPLAENSSCSAAYSISAAGARYMLKNTSPLRGQADWPCDMLPLAPLVTLPRIVRHPIVTAAQSHLDSERRPLFNALRQSRLESRAAAGPRWRRFGQKNYWRRWWLKRRTERISEQGEAGFD